MFIYTYIMPFVKGRPLRRRRARRRTEKPKTVSAVVRSVLNKQAEVKYHDTFWDDLGIDYSGDGYILGNPAAGTTDVTRVGDLINPLRVQIKGQLTCADSTNVMRLIVVQRRAGDWAETSADVAEVLSGIKLATVNAPNSFYLHDTRRQFMILYDKTFAMNLVDHNQVNFNINLDLSKRKLKTRFLAASTTAVSGSYALLVISDSAAASYPEITAVSRFWFNDM